jgi:hypothetical protein
MQQETLNTKYFFTSYEDSRQAFLTLTKGALVKKSIEIADKGEQGHLKGMLGEPLYIDFAVFGNIKDPETILLHTSGVHGVESYCGSAIQLKCLQDFFASPTKLAETIANSSTAIIFIHCLNPWGMSFQRRVNENNVDLNRNCFYEELPGGVASKTKKTQYEIRSTDLRYGSLNSLLNPNYEDLGYYDALAFYWEGLSKLVSYGYSSFKQTIFEGQYRFPKGLFYGGQQLEQEPRIVLTWITKFLTETVDSKKIKKFYHIDVHTGMGDYGETLLVVEKDHDEELSSLFGKNVYPITRDAEDPLPQQEFQAYIANGNFTGALQEMSNRLGIPFYGICQEFGTYSTPTVLRALRFENSAFQKYAEKLPKTHPAKVNLLETFYPASCTYWKTKTLKAGQEFFRKCFDHCTAKKLPEHFRSLKPDHPTESKLKPEVKK